MSLATDVQQNPWEELNLIHAVLLSGLMCELLWSDPQPQVRLIFALFLS